MKNTKHSMRSVLCIILTVLLMLSAVFCVAAAENDVAQTGAVGTVYYENASNWSAVYCYMWNGQGETKNAAWPGEPMTVAEGNVYKYTTSTDYANVIFNNGGNGQQTGDLQFPGDGQIYKGGSWSLYDKHVVVPTESKPTEEPKPTEAPKPTEPSQSKFVYCKNTAGWSDVMCYMWTDGAGNNGSWPGKAMTNIGEDVWQYEITGDFKMCIFNNGSGTQTGNLTFPGDGHIYDNTTGKWDVYDVSPIRVKSTGTDIKSPQYNGTEIILSADATSTGGKVYYKFSVENGGKTTVLQDFSTDNTVAWTPATGTYKIVYDFKDAIGNENQRTAEYVIEDDSALKKPIIKKVTPGSSQLEPGNATINVTAGGGKIGTNLLFYKYTIKNEAGKTVNVPYYTKTATYNYNFKNVGTYTVKVSLQASDNVVAERTYTYEVVGEVIEDPTDTPPDFPTIPTTPTEDDSSSDETTTPGDDYLRGDANADKEVTVFDATLVQQFVANIQVEFIDLANANANLDDDVTVLDATMIQRFVAKLENW